MAGGDLRRQRGLPRALLAATLLLGLAWALLALVGRGGDNAAVIPTAGQLTARGKPVLYHFSAAWCGPCRKMEHEVFADDDVTTDLDERFTRVEVVDRQREDGRNPPRVEELEQRYHVRGFPTLVMAAPNGEELRRLEGYPGRAGTLRFLADDGGAPAGGPTATTPPDS